MATKSDAGEFTWVNFDPAFHSFLVKGAMGAAETPAQVGMVRRAMFVYILELLNNEAEDTFFDLQHNAVVLQRANREKKRLARKLARAAKRERVREAAKVAKLSAVAVPPSMAKQGEVAVCLICSRSFRSRKRLNRHRKSCGGSKPSKTSTDTVSIGGVNTPTSTTPVTAGSGSVVARVYCGRGAEMDFGVLPEVVCEDCEVRSVGRKLGRYPKCLDCMPVGNFEFHSESLRLQWETVVKRL